MFRRIDDFVATVERVGLRSTRFRTLARPRWAHPTGEEFFLLGAIFSLAVADIIETSF